MHYQFEIKKVATNARRFWNLELGIWNLELKKEPRMHEYFEI